MKLSFPAIKPRTLKIIVLGCGIFGLLLRLLLNAAAIDEKGLLISGHPTWVWLWLLTAAVAVIVLMCAPSIQGPTAYRECFPGGILSALGCLPAAICVLHAAMIRFQDGSLLFALAGILAAVSLVVVALCRLLERKPPFVFHAAFCIYLALEMLELYRTWSFDPQLHEYCFQLFACIALSITAYQQAAFDVDRGSHRALWAWSLAAVYFCCMCLDSGLLFPAGSIWALTNLSSLRIRRPRRRMVAETVPDSQ